MHKHRIYENLQGCIKFHASVYVQRCGGTASGTNNGMYKCITTWSQSVVRPTTALALRLLVTGNLWQDKVKRMWGQECLVLSVIICHVDLLTLAMMPEWSRSSRRTRKTQKKSEKKLSRDVNCKHMLLIFPLRLSRRLFVCSLKREMCRLNHDTHSCLIVASCAIIRPSQQEQPSPAAKCTARRTVTHNEQQPLH